MQFVSEALTPVGDFDASAMAQGEPGLPEKFRWRGRVLEISAVLERWKEHGDCKHGSGERYLRKHCYRFRTLDGAILSVYFQRSFGRSRKTSSRWWLQGIEEPPASLGTTDISPKLTA